MTFRNAVGASFFCLVSAPSLTFAAVETPQFSPAAGDSAVTFSVTVTCNTPEAVIRYTVNGSEPTQQDLSIASGNTISISRNLTLRAKAWVGSEASATAVSAYYITGDVAAGSHHVLTLSGTGAVQAWGEQASGRLGNGQSATANVPTPGPSKYSASTAITDAIAIAAGQNHSVFIKSQNRAVWAFGNNASGELGDGSTQNQTYAVRVATNDPPTSWLQNCVMVDCGDNFSGALGADGKVYMWGGQGSGKLGNGATLGNKKYAVNALRGDIGGTPILEGIVQLSLGSGFVLARQATAVEIPGTVWSWGQGGAGRLGQGGTSNEDLAKKVVLNSSNQALTDALYVSAGGSHSVVVRATGNNTVWTFGDGSNGRLGRGSSTSDSEYPVQVKSNAAGTTPLTNIAMVAAGSAHTLALDRDGLVWAWGYNNYGAVGDGSTNDALYAKPVKNPGTATGQLGDAVVGRIVWISAGGDGTNNTSYAVSERGKVYAWGRNDDGELGNGTVTSGDASRPAIVPNLSLVPGYPKVTMTHVVNSSVALGSVTLTAAPSDPDGPSDIKKVEFFSQGVRVGEVIGSTGPWQLTLSNLSAGNYQVHSVVTDQSDNQGESAPIIFTISAPAPNSDLDHDGLTYSTEQTLGTNPDSPDHDGDKMGDGYEFYYGLDPLSANNGLGNNAGPGEHKDTDGLTNKDDADRGLIPTSATESPTITGTFPGSVAKWFGVDDVTYYFEYSTNQTNWERHTTPLVGDNAELSLAISSVVSSLPTPFYTRLVTVSDAPDVTLSANVTGAVAPGAATLTAVPSDANGSGDIAIVRFYLDGALAGTKTGAPWTWSLAGLTAGSHTARAIVTDQGGKRGFSSDIAIAIDSPAPNADSDSDGLPDGWELTHFGSLTSTGSGDPDGDGLSNATEYGQGTTPTLPDTDGDGMGDGYENYYALSPLASVNGQPTLLGPEDDKDGDGLANKDEFDRGLIPTSNVEQPARTGISPNETLTWWGVEGIVYHIDYASVESMAGATRSSATFTGSNSEIIVPLASVVYPVPSPVYFRLVTDSDVPVLSLAVSYPLGEAPETVTLTPTISNPSVVGEIASVDYYLNGNRIKRLTTAPFTHAEPSVSAGSYQAQVVVTDAQGRRGWSEIDTFTITAPVPGADTDSDGLWDSWEMTHFGTLALGASDDPDGDGLTNLQEFTRVGGSTNPMLMDTDGDGVSDDSDTNPLTADSVSVPISNAVRILTPAQH